MNASIDALPADSPLRSLLDPESYSHPTSTIELLETHISWVFLAGEFAYKIKKPVKFEFLDYSTRELRDWLCQREVQINRRYAPELYLGVAPIYQTSRGWSFTGSGDVVEHAVQMIRFSQDQMLLPLLQSGRLQPVDLIPLADRLAAQHAAAESVTSDASTSTQSAAASGARLSPLLRPPVFTADAAGVAVSTAPAFGNLSFLHRSLPDGDDLRHVEELTSWSEQFCEQRQARLIQRIQQRKIRECHGDLHLGNLLMHQGEFRAFDGIEFNEAFRWIDVANELAFLVMDLHDRDYVACGHRVLDRYLEVTGDYDALGVFPFYLAYRALVRAKVERIRQLQQPTEHAPAPTSSRPDKLSAAGLAYLELARKFVQRQQPQLLITHGLSGSGKSTHAAQWIEKRGFIRLRSDAIRKRLLGLAPEASTTGHSEMSAGEVYGAQMTQRTYQELARIAENAIRDGWSVIVDATFLRRSNRNEFAELAIRLGVPFGIVDCQASHAELRRRVSERVGDASEASVSILESQIASVEPLSDTELGARVELD